MIYYIASYPRSGNTWVRNLILNQFGYISTDVHGDNCDRDRLEEWLHNIDDIQLYSLKLPEKKDLFGLSKSDPLYMRMVSFIPPDEKKIDHRTLLPGFKTLFLDASIRKRLAEENEVYFVKSHFQPYDEYFAGEYVIHILRNAGASLWSFYRFQNDVRSNPVSLNDIILGNVAFGHWGHYQTLWMMTASRLKGNFFQVKFEDLVNNELPFCERLASFLRLPILSTQIKPFEYYHQKQPKLVRAGKAGGWEINYSKEQLHLLWQEHGKAMIQLGYGEPDYQFGVDQARY